MALRAGMLLVAVAALGISAVVAAVPGGLICHESGAGGGGGGGSDLYPSGATVSDGANIGPGTVTMSWSA